MSTISLGINWANVAPLPLVLPAGEYVFTILGATKLETGRLVVSTAIKEGEFAGKKYSFSYPDFYAPNGEWAIPEFRRLQLALADDPLEGESEVNYLNRNVGHSFGGRIKEDNSWTPPGETEPRKQAKLVLSSVRPAFS